MRFLAGYDGLPADDDRARHACRVPDARVTRRVRLPPDADRAMPPARVPAKVGGLPGIRLAGGAAGRTDIAGGPFPERLGLVRAPPAAAAA